MSKVDWSLAPEGATHYGIVTSNRICWYAVKSEFRYDYAYQSEGFNAEKWTPSSGKPEHRPLIARPQPKPWSGPEDGLPPVAIDCEYGSDQNGWQRIKVLAHTMVGGLSAVGQIGDKGQICIGTAQYWRPVRTPEQLAAEKRETAIREIESVLESNKTVYASDGARKSYAETIYDAGFKREVV